MGDLFSGLLGGGGSSGGGGSYGPSSGKGSSTAVATATGDTVTHGLGLDSTTLITLASVAVAGLLVLVMLFRK